MVEITLENVTKVFGRVKALDDLSIVIQPGEFLCFLGPSGCGKTTSLRVISGFVTPNSGRILVDGEDITHTPSHKRDIGIVFQDYALFPHMSVLGNIMYGLTVRHVPKQEALNRCREILQKVNLAGFEHRYPQQLSGGQQQRVALARALVINPRMLLFDEPLSNLDARLRVQMRVEIRRIQKEVGLTAVFVTHDQEEALSIADRIAVMERGRIQQIDTPEKIYNNPTNKFVADFIGKSNFFEGKIMTEGDCPMMLTTAEQKIRFSADLQKIKNQNQCTILVRPENMGMFHPMIYSPSSPSANFLRGQVLTRARLGAMIEYCVASQGQKILVHRVEGENDRSFAPGESAVLEWLSEDSVFLTD